MTKRVINHVQEFLTIIDDGKVYQIVNVELLLEKTPTGRCDRLFKGTSK